MNIRSYISIATISITLFATKISAQDFHLSQFDANPLYLNPALTGLRLNEDWNYRFNLNYREQKGNYLGRSNRIFAAGFDKPYNNKFSFGEFIINNNSINSSLNTLNCMLSGAYKVTHKDGAGFDRHNISVGLQAGLLQKSFNNGNFVYDSQYSSSSPSGFDANLPSGENFSRQSTFHFDMNMGVYYRFIDKNKKYSPFGGFSIYHLTQPNQSITDINSQTPMRFTLHGGCFYTINEAISVLPQFMYMNQAKASELNIGAMVYDKIRCTDYQPMLGFAWRRNDAIVIHLGLKYKTYNVRVSYDINTYYLKQYGNRGMEVSFIYTPMKRRSNVDMVATLIILPDSAVVPMDTAKSLMPVLPTVNDSAKSIVQKPTYILIHDTIFIPVKTVIQNSPGIKDSAKTVVPETFITPDTSAMSGKILMPGSVVIKDTTRSIVNITNITIIDSIITRTSLAEPVSPSVKDTSVSNGLAKTNALVTEDSTKAITEKFKNVSFGSEIEEKILSAPKPTMTVKPVYAEVPKGSVKSSLESVSDLKADTSRNAAPIKPIALVKSSEEKSYRVQLGVFKERRPLENANKFLKVADKGIKNFKDNKGNTVYTVGDFSNRDEAINLKMEMVKKGYNNAKVVAVSIDATAVQVKQKKQSVPQSKIIDQPAAPAVTKTSDTMAVSSLAEDSIASPLPVIPVTSATPVAKDSTAIREKLSPDTAVTKNSAFSIAAIKPKILDSLPTNSSYRIQIGAFKELIPVESANKFIEIGAKGIKNLQNKKDFTVYAVGNCPTHDEAIDLKNKMIEKGFKDAFIITLPIDAPITPMDRLVTSSSKTTDSGKTTAPANPDSKISYMVQLGAFKKEVPSELADELLEIGSTGIKNLKDNSGFTVYTIGDFSTHDEAIDLKNAMIEKGFKDAFIIGVPIER